MIKTVHHQTRIILLQLLRCSTSTLGVLYGQAWQAGRYSVSLLPQLLLLLGKFELDVPDGIEEGAHTGSFPIIPFKLISVLLVPSLVTPTNSASSPLTPSYESIGPLFRKPSVDGCTIVLIQRERWTWNCYTVPLLPISLWICAWLSLAWAQKRIWRLDWIHRISVKPNIFLLSQRRGGAVRLKEEFNRVESQEQ